MASGNADASGNCESEKYEHENAANRSWQTKLISASYISFVQLPLSFHPYDEERTYKCWQILVMKNKRKPTGETKKPTKKTTQKLNIIHPESLTHILCTRKPTLNEIK